MKPLPDDPPPAAARFPGHASQARAATLAELDAIVESSSEKNRNFFIATLGLLIYVQAIVFSTTDLQFLTGGDIKLPIVDLPVPLGGFYFVVPIFVIALHFNFLQNLESHHYKLMRWQEAHPGGQVPRARLHAFLFDHATLESGSQLQHWVRWANNILCLNLAPITLGLLLWRYTDRQDAPVTLWHYAWFAFDCFLVWKLRRGFAQNRRADALARERFGTGWLAWPAMMLRFLGDIPRHRPYGVFGLLVLLETALAVFVAEAPSEPFLRYGLPLARGIERWDQRLASWVLPRLAIDPADTVWRPDETVLAAEAKLAGEADWGKHFKDHGQGFRPSTRHLRMVKLPRQRLPRADFLEARMEGSHWVEAQCQRVDLHSAQLQGATLRHAQLQGANLESARLQGTDLGFAQLQGANLRSAQLQGTDLGFALLQGVNLNFAELQGATLQYAQLQGANLKFAGLQGADLRSAQLQGADLDYADVQGAIVGQTGFQGSVAPASSGVWLEQPPFDPSTAGWKGIEMLADAIPNPVGARQAFLARIRAAKSRPPGRTEALLRHDSSAVYNKALPDLCEGKPTLNNFFLRLGLSEKMVFKILPTQRRELGLPAAQGIRRNYRGLEREPANNPELQSTLTEIDRTLCTLPACADLQSEIEGLDCSRFAGKKAR